MNMSLIQQVLSPEQVARMHAKLEKATFVDGRETAGAEAARIKRNLQLPRGSELSSELGDFVRRAVLSNERFRALALPRRMSAPLISRYDVGMEYGPHTDDAFHGQEVLRTDLAVTVFLSDPESYEGGGLVVGETVVRGAAGDMVLYPANTIHRVAQVTRGKRLAAVFWVQSLIRSHEQREILVTLTGIQASLGPSPQALAVSRVQQNLIRMWGE
jgi:PKHD-type hydroxylase